MGQIDVLKRAIVGMAPQPASRAVPHRDDVNHPRWPHWRWPDEAPFGIAAETSGVAA